MDRGLASSGCAVFQLMTVWFGRQFTTSTYVEQAKFVEHHQQAALSNTIDHVTFARVTGPKDYESFTGSTIKHPPEHVGGPPVKSITFSKVIKTAAHCDMQTVGNQL